MNHKRVAKLLREHLGVFFREHMPSAKSGVLITIKDVQVSPDLGFARVHLSLLPIRQLVNIKSFFNEIVKYKKVMKIYVVKQIGKKVRKVPSIDFRIDEQSAKAAEVHQMLIKVKNEK